MWKFRNIEIPSIGQDVRGRVNTRRSGKIWHTIYWIHQQTLISPALNGGNLNQKKVQASIQSSGDYVSRTIDARELSSTGVHFDPGGDMVGKSEEEYGRNY